VNHILQALNNLSNKQNVVVKLIGYTDNTPLAGRDERIYGNHLGLSKARARRAALALQEALKLPTSAIDSDGRGNVNPIASNDAESGRALNRRIEVEFWYDDMLADLPDEPQLCPEDAALKPSRASTSRRAARSGRSIREWKSGRAGRLCGTAAHAHERVGQDQCPPAVHRLHQQRAPRPAHRRGLRRRHRPVHGAGAPRHGGRQAMLALNDKQAEFDGRGYVQTTTSSMPASSRPTPRGSRCRWSTTSSPLDDL
jgi:hypothetical protein